MISELTINKQELDLTNLKLILAAQNVETTLLKASETNSLPTLIIPVEIEYTSQDSHYSATFIPMDPDFVESNSLLQFYYIHDLKIRDGKELDVRRFIADLNLIVPLGSFGLNSDNEIYFRYVSIQDQFEVLKEDTAIETVMLFESSINSFIEFMHAINDGEMTSQEAMEIVREIEE